MFFSLEEDSNIIGSIIIPEASNQKCSVKKGVLRNFAKFTGKHLFYRTPLENCFCHFIIYACAICESKTDGNCFYLITFFILFTFKVKVICLEKKLYLVESSSPFFRREEVLGMSFFGNLFF